MAPLCQKQGVKRTKRNGEAEIDGERETGREKTESVRHALYQTHLSELKASLKM